MKANVIPIPWGVGRFNSSFGPPAGWPRQTVFSYIPS